ncbi:MAG: hypothetical protein WBW41_06870 [Verrucomicrobiia bacterium]
MSAKLDAVTALAASGALPENVNYAVKSSFLLSFLESVPDVSAQVKAPNTADRKFEDVVKQAQVATVLVLVYWTPGTRSADLPVCGFGGHACPLALATGKSPEPAGWKACSTISAQRRRRWS